MTEEARLTCKRCGATIQPRTARKYRGYCARCGPRVVRVWLVVLVLVVAAAGGAWFLLHRSGSLEPVERRELSAWERGNFYTLAELRQGLEDTRPHPVVGAIAASWPRASCARLWDDDFWAGTTDTTRDLLVVAAALAKCDDLLDGAVDGEALRLEDRRRLLDGLAAPATTYEEWEDLVELLSDWRSADVRPVDWRADVDRRLAASVVEAPRRTVAPGEPWIRAWRDLGELDADLARDAAASLAARVDGWRGPRLADARSGRSTEDEHVTLPLESSPEVIEAWLAGDPVVGRKRPPDALEATLESIVSLRDLFESAGRPEASRAMEAWLGRALEVHVTFFSDRARDDVAAHAESLTVSPTAAWWRLLNERMAGVGLVRPVACRWTSAGAVSDYEAKRLAARIVATLAEEASGEEAFVDCQDVDCSFADDELRISVRASETNQCFSMNFQPAYSICGDDLEGDSLRGLDVRLTVRARAGGSPTTVFTDTVRTPAEVPYTTSATAPFPQPERSDVWKATTEPLLERLRSKVVLPEAWTRGPAGSG